MRALKYIMLFLAASLMWGCQGFDEHNMQPTVDPSTSDAVVTRLADGRLQVRGTMKASSMTQIATRATADEDVITEGWCLMFGQDAEHEGDEIYSDASPLIQKQRVTVTANGEFVVILSEYQHTSYMRIVANLSKREKGQLALARSWLDVNTDGDGNIDTDKFATPPTAAEVASQGITTFRVYRYQSEGLDAIYQMDNYNTRFRVETVDEYLDISGAPSTTALIYETPGGKTGFSTIHKQAETYNVNQPDPSQPITTGFPMTSYGVVLTDGITEASLKECFGSLVHMIRICSKVTVEAVDETFTIKKVYLPGAAQESRLRSTVLRNQSTMPDGTVVLNPVLGLPKDLGGSIDYLPLEVAEGARKSDPIYFYPNKGGNYPKAGESSDPTVINPQYVIVYGQSSLYDSPGYYKLALKAQYPLTSASDETNKDDDTKWSALTYDILRNTSFNIRLLHVDKQGYKTYEDAASTKSPANNINFSIEIESEDNRHEILVSNGTYYAEMETSRVYVKGYMNEGVEGCYVDFKMIPAPMFSTPAVYIQANGYDESGACDYGSEDIEVTQVKVLRSSDSGYAAKNWDLATSVELTENKDIADGELDSKWFKIDYPTDINDSSRVRIYFNAKGSGRLRLRIGDMLKFIPVVYDPAPISIYGTKGQDDATDPGIVVQGDNGVVWSDFAYSEISYLMDSDLTINPDGTIVRSNFNVFDYRPELRALIHPAEPGDGVATIYLRQGCDFKLWNNRAEAEAEDIEVEYYSNGTVYSLKKGTLPEGNEFSYIIKCDEEDVTLGDIAENEFYDFGQPKDEPIALNKPLNFKVRNIGTNGGNPTLVSDVNFKLENTRGEVKTYNIKITQYVAPSADEDFDVEVDQNGNSYITPKPSNNSKDFVNAYTGKEKKWWEIYHKYPITDAGETLEEVEVYNCFYKEWPDGIFTDDEGLEWGWRWEAVPSKIAEKNNLKLTAEEQKARVSAVFSVGHRCVKEGDVDKIYGEYGTHVFPITVNAQGNSAFALEKYDVVSAYFVLVVRNRVGEQCETRMLIQCTAK